MSLSLRKIFCPLFYNPLLIRFLYQFQSPSFNVILSAYSRACESVFWFSWSSQLILIHPWVVELFNRSSALCWVSPLPFHPIIVKFVLNQFLTSTSRSWLGPHYIHCILLQPHAHPNSFPCHRPSIPHPSDPSSIFRSPPLSSNLRYCTSPSCPEGRFWYAHDIICCIIIFFLVSRLLLTGLWYEIWKIVKTR